MTKKALQRILLEEGLLVRVAGPPSGRATDYQAPGDTEYPRIKSGILFYLKETRSNIRGLRGNSQIWWRSYGHAKGTPPPRSISRLSRN